MTNWIHRLLNPHCPHCIEEDERNMVCPTCEVLKQQLDVANTECHNLLNRLTAKPEPEPIKEPPQVTMPRSIPWSVRRQMLEAEDRERARLMREAPKPASTEELEKELEIAQEQREAGH